MAIPTIGELTEVEVTGSGVFDVLMQATKAHLQEEYSKGRIKGPEYSTVYLGAIQSVMDRALEFLLTREKVEMENQLIQAQILNAQTERDKILAEIQLVNAQVTNAAADKLRIDAQTALLEQQALNAATENTLLVAQECKLRAEYDLIMEQKLKTIAETALLSQKKVTEAAQTTAMGVDEDSVIGKQKALYTAQTGGYQRDAEQKAAKLLVDSWNVRRTTDEGTSANTTNQLDDATVGRAISKLLTGVGA